MATSSGCLLRRGASLLQRNTDSLPLSLLFLSSLSSLFLLLFSFISLCISLSISPQPSHDIPQPFNKFCSFQHSDLDFCILSTLILVLTRRATRMHDLHAHTQWVRDTKSDYCTELSMRDYCSTTVLLFFPFELQPQFLINTYIHLSMAVHTNDE